MVRHDSRHGATEDDSPQCLSRHWAYMRPQIPPPQWYISSKKAMCTPTKPYLLIMQLPMRLWGANTFRLQYGLYHPSLPVTILGQGCPWILYGWGSPVLQCHGMSYKSQRGKSPNQFISQMKTWWWAWWPCLPSLGTPHLPYDFINHFCWMWFGKTAP